ncbi:hypothetical protein [Bartonella sp. MM73XJBT]|nr:hypothetical protein [Bartonella sp. MM73XJBT]
MGAAFCEIVKAWTGTVFPAFVGVDVCGGEMGVLARQNGGEVLR